MKKYIIYIREVHLVPVEVEANNVSEAMNAANDKLASGDVDYDLLEYDYTLDTDQWSYEEC